MLAYTAWDGLHTIARQYDADLRFDAGHRLGLAPRWLRTSAASAFRRLTARVHAGTSVA